MVFLLLLLLPSITYAATTGRQRHGVVFGGNGFIGSATVERLLRNGDNITVINRGTPYWDSKSRIFPRVNHLQYDRLQNVSEFRRVEHFLKRNHFDYVVDFSGTSKFAIEQVTEALQGNVDLYILISKDSIYELCEYEKYSNHAVSEDGAVRVTVPEEKKELEDSYKESHRKLQAEEALMSQRQNGGIPYVILRPSDVIGPRDTNYYWVTYQLWAKVASVRKEVPLTVPQFLTDHNMSLVYVEDVAEAILKVVELNIKDEAINLAWKEFFHLDYVLEVLVQSLNIKNVKVHVAGPDESVHYFYPGVTSSPLDVAKAERLLRWNPVPFEEAVRETVNFYEHVMKEDQFTQQRNEIIQHVVAHLFSNEERLKLNFYRALEKLYNIDLHHFTRHHDEL